MVASEQWQMLRLLDVDKIMSKWEQAWWVWPDGVADPRITGGVEQAYVSWMSRDVSQAAEYVTSECFVESAHLGSLVRFRLGAHNLQVAVGRWAQKSRASGGRVCRWCVPGRSGEFDGDVSTCLGGVEDEKHVMMECPRYSHVRQHVDDVIGGCEGDVRSLMCHKQQASVAHFVHKVLKQHAEPIVLSEASEDELVTGSELDDESELVEVSSEELLPGALLEDDRHVDDDDAIYDVAAGVAHACSDASSDGLLLCTLLGEVDDEM